LKPWLKYFLGIEVATSKKRVFVSQRKHRMDLFKETEKPIAEPIDSPVGVLVRLYRDKGNSYKIQGGVKDWLGQ